MSVKNYSQKQHHCALTTTPKTTALFRPLAAVSIAIILAVAAYIVPSAGAKDYPEPGTTALNPDLSLPSAAAEFPASSWQTATPQEVGMDPVKFAAAMNLLPSPSVVIRNGRIVGQKGDNCTDWIHLVWKQIVNGADRREIAPTGENRKLRLYSS